MEPVESGGSRRGADLVRDLVRRGRLLPVRLMDQRGTADRRLTIAIAIVCGCLALARVDALRAAFPFGIDLEIPLRAATHWSSGAPVYPPSAMQVHSGLDLPYLYPPFLLPLLSSIAGLPRQPVLVAWFGLCLLASVWTCRRLGIPWIAVPCLLAWPPFGEALIVGNVQVFLFAAFVAVFYQPGEAAPEQRELRPGRDLPNGLLAALVGALKVAQMLPVLYLARRRFRAAFLGVAVLATVALATLPWTGVGIYGDWLAQLQRASDPAWTIGGGSLGRGLGIPDSILIAIGIVLALAVRGRDSVAWLGIVLIVAAPSVHGFTFLFLLPALLSIRRDIAIPVGALFLIPYTLPPWLATLIAACLLAASSRQEWLHAQRGPNQLPESTARPAAEGSPAAARWLNLLRARRGRVTE